MTEIKTLIDGKQIAYSGLFRMEELYTIIKRLLRERGYFTIEVRNQEDVFETGKQVIVQLEPGKQLSDYAKGKMRVIITVKDLKDKVVEIDGHKQKLQQGNVTIALSAFLETDLREQWEGKGWQFLFRTLSNKFIRKEMIHEAEGNTIADCNALAEEVKSYLNMSKFTLASKK